MYQKILVTLDGSELAERAIHYATTIARRVNGEIIVFSVFEREIYEENLMRVYLEKKAEELQALGLKATVAIGYGDAADGIVNFSEKNDIDLIVMCTHGRSGITRWITGSISSKVIQESYTPLLLIKTGAMQTEFLAEELCEILVPLDGSKYSEAALPYATNIANKLNCEIVLLRVNNATELSSYLDPEFIPGWELYLAQAMPDIQDGLQNYLLEAKKRLEAEGFSVRSEFAFGRAADEIIKYAESHDINLIVMTTHGRSGFSHWAYGGVAYKLIHGTSKPTLLIRPRPSILNSNS